MQIFEALQKLNRNARCFPRTTLKCVCKLFYFKTQAVAKSSVKYHGNRRKNRSFPLKGQVVSKIVRDLGDNEDF